MNESVGTAIEKIKLIEQDNENKLKEKREYDAMVSTLNRSIKETLQQTEKLDSENGHLMQTIDGIKAELVVEKTRRDALVMQSEICKKELDDLKNESDQGIAKVWELRSELCSAVQAVADKCDVRALLIKRMKPEFKPITPALNNATETSPELAKSEDRLNNAAQRRLKAIAERERLKAEPDIGEEYIRIKNALQYSLDMLSKLSK